ncbi:MAG TPA: nuclear transport factor 2 family protein [Vicinamibacterales bacterium]|nr:nuclear transport factor 2 family protein [Vicinamibacterales bacterium]
MSATRSTGIGLGLLAALVLCSAVAVGAQRVKSDQDTLMQLERDWDAAFHRGDAKFIASILADDFIATYDNGVRADKAKELDLAANFNQQIDASSLDEFTIHIYGDVAVVWFTLRLLGPIQGKPVQMTYRYMDVWRYQDGKWLCVASQSTRVQDEKPKAE